MEAHRAHHLRRLLVGIAITVFGSLGLAAGASAGGWAVTTLDAVPSPLPGEPTDVGFTIRQHGVTPVDLPGVALVVTGADGTTTVFPALGDGRVGHYVATIVVPEAGSYRWLVRQGDLGEQALGMLVTADGDATSAGGWQAPDPLVPGLAVLAALFAALAVVDAVHSRRRPAAVAGIGVTSGPAPRAT
jgi:hypothetical protein